MTQHHGVVIVGASLAGARTALELREQGYDGPVTLVGAEPHLPYERPRLSKAYLVGGLPFEQLLVSPAEDYDRLRITLRLGVAATSLDVENRRVRLADGDELAYDELVLATGSANLRPPIPGIDLPGVHQLRTRDDADALRAAAAGAERAVVIGTGFLGCELAATLRGQGLAVTAVDALPGPMWVALGPELSAVVRGWHEENGVELRGGVGVTAIEGDDVVRRVVLADGSALDADLVVVAVGARPDLRWLADAPLHLAAGGIGVDADGRAAPGVWAVGDVAAVWDGEQHRRAEHYGAAISQAVRVGHALMGREAPVTRAQAFWSEQYGHFLQYAGRHAEGDEVVIRNEPYAAYFLRDGILTAVATVDNGRELRRAMKLLGTALPLSECTSLLGSTRTA